jgi:phosphoglycolate phosphatase-like HAD superfamily hydrolase
MRVILFDIDGTLLLTGGAGLVALRRVFSGLHGVADAVDGIEFHGRTDPLILDSIARRWLGRPLDEAEMEAVVEGYLDQLEACLREAENFRVLPGAAELVEELSGRQDIVLGLATGNLEPAARAKLRRAGLGGRFGPGGFGSDSPDRAELTRLAVQRGRAVAGARAEVVVVGDTVHDVRAASAAGVPCLAVATGNASAGALAAEGAEWAVPSLEEPSVREILGLAPRPERPSPGV